MGGRRVVVTGLGAVCPAGMGVDASWASVLAGRSPIELLPFDWAGDLPVRFAGVLPDDPAEGLDHQSRRRLDRAQHSALAAFEEAWQQAGSPEVDPDTTAVSVASGMGGILTLLANYDRFKEQGAYRLPPFGLPALLPNGPAAAVGVRLGARAGLLAPASACAASAEALFWGAELISSGRADVVVAGGAEAAVHPLPLAGFAAMRALSTRNDDPASASRPFDVDRDGFVFAEGAAMLVLESAEHAAARGATPLAELAGWGLRSDGFHFAQPDPDGAGAAAAMGAALSQSELTAGDVRFVNAHATSTPQGDLAEARAIASVFPHGPWVSSTKSVTGHLLGAAGALEAVFTVRSLQDRVVPPSINIEQVDPEIDVNVAVNRSQVLPQSGPLVGVSNSFGFGGHDVSLLFATP